MVYETKDHLLMLLIYSLFTIAKKLPQLMIAINNFRIMILEFMIDDKI